MFSATSSGCRHPCTAPVEADGLEPGPGVDPEESEDPDVAGDTDMATDGELAGAAGASADCTGADGTRADGTRADGTGADPDGTDALGWVGELCASASQAAMITRPLAGSALPPTPPRSTK